MKIGILTFQHSINFGAQLQCYALQEVLKKIGHEPEVIQYHPDNVKTLPFYRGANIKRVGLCFALQDMILRCLYANKMRKRFTAFKKQYINLSIPYNYITISNVNDQYDAIIVGSDQVWGPFFHHHPIYFIGWFPEYKGKKISYAPCCAYNEIKGINKPIISKLLSKFDFISVRNDETKQFVQSLVGLNAPIVLDPTFLYDFSTFNNAIKCPYKKYILTYIIGNEITGGHKKIINKIKEKRGNLPVISIILTERKAKYFGWSNKNYYTLNPIEWISLIANADYLYTDSFHGVVFALKSNINFLAYYVDLYRASRFIDFSKRFYIESNIVVSVEDALNRDCIKSGIPDFSKTHDFIDDQIRKSYSFLQQSLCS
jgi:hypothetical protein